MSSRRKATGGFTLLEVLVALVVLGVSFVTIFELFQGGLQALSASRQHTLAFMHAREKLEELTLEDRPAAGERRGTFEDGFRWETLVSLYPLPQIEDEKLEMETFQLTARVFYRRIGRERSVELNTLKLVLPEPKTIQHKDKL
ncbi:MAG: prepilin-type N-terminal cleavage/methylation domain-containing protein [Deltaproteobacteria bacterium]|nr:prepilin-type N-terminal cleavage/methylation domain-containing protein [Deltaproteobacteria bacterium]MBW2307057.1 prepilin-type N-terminal cleavage/methylation domain-containing protein [Deltaproteobacteria bacterium]